MVIPIQIKIKERISKKTKTEILLITLSIVFGVVNTYLLVGWPGINPLNLDWLHGDVATHYLGWAFLRQEGWSFPPTWSESLGYPLGISVSYLDSIPLIAVLLKPFSVLLPDEFQYLGIYLVFSSIFQAYFGFKLCRLLCKGDLFFSVLGGLLLLLSPVFTWRFFGHIALTSHWLILAGLYYYFLASPTVIKKIIPQLIILAIAGGIHPYLALMCLLITFAVCLSLKISKRVTARGAIALGIMAVVTLAISFIMFGFLLIGDRGQYSSAGYGLYSMNLLAPIDPQIYGSLLLKDLPNGTDGQVGEGYNYLGLGVILLLFLVIARHPREVFKLKTGKILPLLVLFLISLALAASKKITFGSIVIIDLELPDKIAELLNIFRGSGRLFWPGFYLLTIAAIVLIFKNFSPRHRKILISIALVLQLLDLSSLRAMTPKLYQSKYTSPLKSEQWQTLGKEHKHLVVIPAWQCGADNALGGSHSYWIFGRLAAEQKLTINSLYAARMSKENWDYYCSEMPSQLQQGKLDRESAYVLSDELVRSLSQQKISSHYCQRVDGFNLCRVGDNISGFSPEIFNSTTSNYILGADILFSGEKGKSEALKYQISGWSGAEDWGTWTDGKQASLLLKLDSLPTSDLQLIAEAGAYLDSLHPKQNVDVIVNGTNVGRWTFSTEETLLPERQVIIPAELVKDNNILQIDFRILNPQSPANVSESTDTRLLGLAVKKIRIIPSENP